MFGSCCVVAIVDDSIYFYDFESRFLRCVFDVCVCVYMAPVAGRVKHFVCINVCSFGCVSVLVCVCMDACSA